jgi:hypothetical protein
LNVIITFSPTWRGGPAKLKQGKNSPLAGSGLAASALVIAATRLTNAHAKSNEPIRLLTNFVFIVLFVF